MLIYGCAQDRLLFYADDAGDASALRWIEAQGEAVQDKLWAHIARLEESGHELRRPISAPLRDKIHELRVRHQQVNYRLLYFFHGQDVAVLAHGCTKEKEVDGADIDRAVARRAKFIRDPGAHTYDDGDEGDD